MAVAAGIVGSFALLRKTVLAGDVMSHIALPGLGLAFLFKFNPLLGAGTTLFLGAVLIWELEKKTGLSTDAMIGVIFSASIAIGALLTPNEDLIEALFGGFGKITFIQFAIGVTASLFVILVLLKYRNQLILSLFSQDLAAVSGVKINRLNFCFLLIFSLTILLALQFLGALLVGALLMVPAIIGRQLTHTFIAFLIASALASVIAVLIGILISRVYHLPPGPMIISVATAIFLISLFKKKT